MLLVFTVLVRGLSQEERVTVESDSLTIGSAATNGLVLTLGHVASRHARVLYKGGGEFIVLDLGTQSGTFLNDVAVSAPTTATADDRLRIGSYELRLSPESAQEDREAALVRLIQERPDDEQPRLVFSDWLEEQGEPARAEYVRLQVEIGRMGEQDPELSDAGRRFRRLAEDIPIEWRAALARPPIEGCGIAFELACPKSWDRLPRSGSDTARFCATCDSEVHYAASIEQARRLAWRGQCVAVDVIVRRMANDLAVPSERPRVTAGIIMPMSPRPGAVPPLPGEDATFVDDEPPTERDPEIG